MIKTWTRTARAKPELSVHVRLHASQPAPDLLGLPELLRELQVSLLVEGLLRRHLWKLLAPCEPARPRTERPAALQGGTRDALFVKHGARIFLHIPIWQLAGGSSHAALLEYARPILAMI